MGKNLKILHLVQDYYPAVGGMSEVVKQLSERIVSMGHHVSVATSNHSNRSEIIHNGVEIISFDIRGNEVVGFTGNTNAYVSFLLKSEFDVVTLFAAQQWATDLALPILEKIKGKKIFVPTGFSYLNKQEYFSYYEVMKAKMKLFDMNIFLSDDYQDIRFARENNITKTCLIPNGASEEEFLIEKNNRIRKKLGIPEKDFLILHVGSFTGAKGHKEAVEIFIRSSISNSTLLMIGNNNRSFKRLLFYHFRYLCVNLLRLLKRKRIRIVELNRVETVDSFLNADLFLFPSNIECSPIVLFECMASKTPFLSSDVGNAKEIVNWSGGGRILPTKKNNIGWSNVNISDSVHIIQDLIKEKNTILEMGLSGYNSWKNKFTWSNIAMEYLRLYKKLCQFDEIEK